MTVDVHSVELLRSRFRVAEHPSGAYEWLSGLSPDALDALAALSGEISAFGEQLVAPLSPKAAWRFDYGINTRLYTTTITGGTVERTYLLTDNVTLQTINYGQGELVLQPGESATIGIQNSLAAGTQHVETINWLEAF